MADIRIPTPATGTLGNTPAISPTNTMPRWVYLALALACAAMGAWASVVTLRYFEHGAAALETDPAMQALAVGAALLFVASEMAAFALAALLTERQLKARRWGLTAFAVAVLALEVFTIVAVQLALTVGADMSQTTVQTQEADLRARIAALEAGAAAKRATAEKQRLTARDAYELRLSAKSSDGATAEQAKTAALYDELKTVQSQKRPTLTGLLGEKYALAYAIARGILISVAGLVFFGTAGALLRAARGGTLSVDAQLLALLHELRGIHVAPTAPAQIVTPVAPALATSYRQPHAVAPAGAPTGLAYSSKVMLAGGGALAAMAAPVAHSAPHAPAVPASAGASASASEQTHTSASERAHLAETEQHQAGASGSSEKPGQSESEQAHSGATEQAHPASASAGKTDAPKRARTATAVPDGDKLDSAVSGKGATRYSRVKAAVKAGKLKPSMRAIQAAEGGGGIVVRRYLQALEREGVIVKAGRGVALASKTGGEA